MGVGSLTNVLRRMPIGEEVMVILIVSSISVEVQQGVRGDWEQRRIPDTTSQPSGAAKCVSIGPCGVASAGTAGIVALSPS